MNIILEINESTWQYELDKFNAAESTKVTQSNVAALRQHTALTAHTPELKRTVFAPTPDFVPLTIEQYVAKTLAEKEAAITASRTTDHLATLAQQSPETIARLAKVTMLPEAVKDQLAAQVDAL